MQPATQLGRLCHRLRDIEARSCIAPACPLPARAQRKVQMAWQIRLPVCGATGSAGAEMAGAFDSS